MFRYLIFCFFLLNACSYTQDDIEEGRVMPTDLVAPIVVGSAIVREVRDVKLSIDILEDSQCTRLFPIDMHRLEITRKDATRSVVYSRFLSSKNFLVQEKELVKGSYELKLFHQDHPDKAVLKSLEIVDLKPNVSLKLPCLGKS